MLESLTGNLRCDYEMVDSEGANKMMELLQQTADNGSLVNKTLTGGSSQDQKTYQVKLMDDFSYKDPIDESVTKKQVKRLTQCCYTCTGQWGRGRGWVGVERDLNVQKMGLVFFF